MRERRMTSLLSVLALTIVSLLVAPVATFAASGLPATVTMFPEAAGPGATVEVTGLDFPGDATVAVQLRTAAGTATLATATTADAGHFREVVSLPVDAPEGVWELLVTGPDGATAAYAFEASPAAVAALVPDTPVLETTAQAAEVAVGSGNSPSDIMVMLVVALVLGVVAIGVMSAWRVVRYDDLQPGMGSGDDLIWSGSLADSEAQPTAADEPFWKTAHSES